jgi:hypothetical protein
MSTERKTYNMAEFAALFGRKRHWAYKLKQLKKIKVIEGYGEIMVPASEVEKILSEQSLSS